MPTGSLLQSADKKTASRNLSYDGIRQRPPSNPPTSANSGSCYRQTSREKPPLWCAVGKIMRLKPCLCKLPSMLTLLAPDYSGTRAASRMNASCFHSLDLRVSPEIETRERQRLGTVRRGTQGFLSHLFSEWPSASLNLFYLDVKKNMDSKN